MDFEDYQRQATLLDQLTQLIEQKLGRKVKSIHTWEKVFFVQFEKGRPTFVSKNPLKLKEKFDLSDWLLVFFEQLVEVEIDFLYFPYHESETEQLLKKYRLEEYQIYWLNSCFYGAEDMSLPQLKTRYRELSLQYHPDTGGTAEQFRLIKEKYDLLISDLENNYFGYPF